MFKYINIYIILVTGFLLACNTSTTDKTDSVDVETVIEAEIKLDSFLLANKVVEKLDYIIENLQSSDNLIKQLSSDINLFSDGILNDVSNISVYESAREKALNLGIYGADLNYLIHFSQTQSSFKYLLTSKQLADQIGVAMAFDQSIIEEYQSKSENKDTLLNIVFGAYKDVKSY
ncbi:MAG: hypothetical protein IPO21_06880 [Bacteroidales bacterium]|nr:hypothetical protein [Bacteroidales bacterium]